MDCAIYICAKTKVLISSVVTTQLICAFVFSYAKSRFSHDAAQLVLQQLNVFQQTNSVDPERTAPL